MGQSIIVNVFGGEIPKIADHLLSDEQSSVASNCFLGSGELRTWQADQTIAELITVGEINSILNYDNFWYAFNENISFAKAPIVGDEYDRLVFTGKDVPRVTNTELVTPSSFDSYKLGIPAPASEATVVLDGGGTAPTTDTIWTYTYVREWSDGKIDEGPPAPVTDIYELDTGETATLSDLVVPADYADYGITDIYIYRTVTGSESAAFQYVGSVEVTSSTSKTFIDNVAQADLGEVMASASWNAPPDDLQGIINIGSGIMAGYVGNTIYLSDTFQAHGWPTSYTIPIEYNIKGLGVFNNMLIVCTEGFPVTIYIGTQDQYQIIPHRELLPCKSSRSIISTKDGVVYAGHTGVVLIDQQGPQIITQNIFDERDWNALDPTSITSIYHNNKYFFFWKATTPVVVGGITELQVSAGGYILNLNDKTAGLTEIQLNSQSVYRRVEDSELYYSITNDGITTIYKWEGITYQTKNFTWTSKEFLSLGGRINFSAARVLGRFAGVTFDPETGEDLENVFDLLIQEGLFGSFNEHTFNEYAWNGDRLYEIMQYYQEPKRLYFKLYVDDRLVFTKQIENDRMFRLPTSISGRRFKVEVSGNIDVQQIQIATSAQEIV